MDNTKRLTLLDALNAQLGLPIFIRIGDRVIKKTAIKRIINGEVKVNEFTITNPEHELTSGDYIRYGCQRYNKDSFYVNL